ncbi:MAG: 7-carboxy-7-deazaguanine synthase QueE [Opitutaceae bacterium]|nr:7-carboxy-7-deazaguanine synthase QueE [Cytophagales bacterium]
MEAFYTIQGEGYFQGSAAYFIRLAGCDIGCHWCDVKESWDVNKHPMIAVDDIVAEASKYPSRIAVITGGEPLMHNLGYLTETLHKFGFRTHIETSGAYPISGSWDWICLSPKKFKEPLPEVCLAAHELKAIIFNKSDFLFAEKYNNLVNSNCKLFLQPEWDKQADILPSIIEYVKQHIYWKVSLQVHKYMQIP